ncbi:MAG: cell division protein FtsZ [Bacteroidales bacterium]|nr:cell division protein FtsZ [Bacteroidales bacterium]
MTDQDFVNFSMPKKTSSIIKVFGVGGSGSNAVNTMFVNGIKDVEFYIFNTDIQHFDGSEVPNKIQLGANETEGLGAGNNPEKGKASAIESLDTIQDILNNNTKMLFIAAGMGGGTGTGAAPVIAKEAKEKGILTVAIVTFPMANEGRKRRDQAIKGIEELKEHVDSLLIINNQRILDIFGDLTMTEANKKADEILTIAAKGIAEIITVRGSINVDFADVDSIMRNSGVSLMCNGVTSGEDRVEEALKQALNSPLLNDNDIHGAKNILVNITAGQKGVLASELGKILDSLQELAGDNADVIWGIATDETLDEEISITIIATGFEVKDITEANDNQYKKPQATTPKPEQSKETTDSETPEPIENTIPIIPESTTAKSIKIKSTKDIFENIDTLEETPAIQRNVIQGSLFYEKEETETEEQQDEISHYSIRTDEDNDQPNIDENPYFDKKVD